MRKIKKQILTFLIVLVLGVSIILTACKKTTSYTYSFDVDGGVSIGNVSIEEGADYTLPTTAEKDGYVFEGWYDNPEFSGDAVTSVKATANLTFYAKWSKLYVATLTLNGGALNTTSVSIKEGANLADALKDLNPTKSGVTFAGWFKDGKALTAADVMPKQDITLEAKFKQSYTIEYYQQKMDGSGYDKAEEETGSAILGETFTPAKKEFVGFNEVTKSDTVDSIVVNEDASQNVIKKYYDRNQCTITLNSNYPTDQEDVVTTKNYIAGSKIELTNDLTCEGYLLVGWSTTKDGEAVYQLNPISSVYNDSEGSGLPSSTEDLVATETQTLYAVWEKGYTDMFGGQDYIYLFEEENTIFLKRYDLFFKGEYRATNQSFTFYDTNDDVLLNGKFITENTFAYYSELRTNGAYTLVDISGINENVMLYFLDGYNGCEYAVKDSEGISTVSKGTYVATDENEYVITFTEGPLADQKLLFFIGILNNKAVFKVRNDAELELSGLGVYTIKNGVPTLDENVELTFDGYGSCTLGKTDYLCSYDSEKAVLTLYSTNGDLAGYLKVVEYADGKGLADYVEELDHTYQSGADTLTLDGVFTATYKTGSEEVKGTYSFSSSFLNFAIIDFQTEAKENYKFTLVHDVKVNEANPEESTVDYLFNKVEKEYNEYLYQDAEGVYYAPLIVTETSTQASLYGYTETGEFVKVSSGTYSLDQESGRYTYTVTSTFDGVTAITDPFDLTKIQSIVYKIDTFDSYPINYWFEYQDTEGTVTSLVKEYTWDTEIDKKPVTLVLRLVGAKASILIQDLGREVNGSYSQKEANVLSIELPDGSSMLVELDETNKTFAEIYETYTMCEYKNNEINRNVYFKLDKNGKLTYVVETPATDNTPASKVELEGTIIEDGVTTSDTPIYQFTSKDETTTFKFIMLGTATEEYFSRYDETLDVTYTGVDGSAGGYLVLDGYGFKAMATIEGEVIVGLYVVDQENNVVTFTDENEDIYFFDIDPVAKTYTLRGYEYGSYFLLNNQAIDYFVKLDGYGKAELYTVSGEEQVLVDDKATYSADEEDYLILTYTVDNKQITDTCVLTTYILSGNEYPAIAVSHKEVVSKYVNEADWSILLVDEFGLATLYNPEGFVQEGSCSILSNELLYFVTNDGTYAGIYQFDIETGALSQANLRLRSFYTNDFESLIFTDYGMLVDNGSADAYYNVENGKIVVYSYEPKSASANEYGYVKNEFGPYGENEIIYNEKTYYINTGYAIQFNRADSDKLNDGSYKYPFVNSKEEKLAIEALYFSPTGKEFNVTGQIKIGGETYPCTIVREKLADDSYQAYVVVEDQYYIDITITYGGIDEAEESLSTFTVTGFKNVLEIPSFDYVYLCWYISQMLGQDAYGMIDNSYGSITMNWEYDETGAEKSSYANTTFAGTAALKDSLGNDINLNESKYESFIDTSNGKIYVNASVVAKDGYTYNLYLQTEVIEDYNHLGMAVVAMTRTQTLTAGEYSVEVEQLVYYEGTSDVTQSNSLGEIYAINISKDSTDIPVELIFTDDYGHTFAVSRTHDETTQKITSTVYYSLGYTLAAAEEGNTYVPLYETFTVTETAVTTYYTADGNSYVDILADGTLEIVSKDGEFVTYTNPTYDETTHTYTYDVEGKSSYKTYSVVITEGVATITFVKETPKTEVEVGN